MVEVFPHFIAGQMPRGSCNHNLNGKVMDMVSDDKGWEFGIGTGQIRKALAIGPQSIMTEPPIK